jgi:hypothetical protein
MKPHKDDVKKEFLKELILNTCNHKEIMQTKNFNELQF